MRRHGSSLASAVLIAVILTSCASTSKEDEKARASKVRIVTDRAIVNGCQAIGSVTDDDIADLQTKVLRLGGDVGLVTKSHGARGAFGSYASAFGSRTYTTVDV